MPDHDETRQQIEALEKDVLEALGRLAELRRSLPPEEVEDHELRDSSGAPLRLADLFGAQSDLVVVHNMGRGCPYCTLWADGLNGVVQHLEDRAGFAVVSPDPPQVQTEFARSRGWRFRMLSDPDSAFARAMGYATEKEGKTYALPGVSTFRRRDDGSVVRIAHSPFGPGDPFCAVWHLFDLLEGGPAGWQPKFAY